VTLATEIAKRDCGSPHDRGEPSYLFTGGKQVNHLRNFMCNEQGAELAEYAVGTAILVAVAIIVYKVLGDAVNVKMSTVANEVQK
jgi:Flp pilus assembly pilin Flp